MYIEKEKELTYTNDIYTVSQVVSSGWVIAEHEIGPKQKIGMRRTTWEGVYV